MSETIRRRRGKASKGKTAELNVQRLPLSRLKPHPRNPRKHPEPGTAQWKALKRSLEHDYFDPLVWNKRNRMLVSGHLRRKVLAEMGVVDADVVVVDYDEPTHLARLLAANNPNGEDDLGGLGDILREISELPDFDQMLTAMPQGRIEDFLTSLEGGDHNPYTVKVAAPVYEPQEERPPKEGDLVDATKAEELIAAIDAEDSMPDELKRVLTLAAYRHCRIDYDQMAEYYCHAPANVQRLMEDSALVIIDFESAIAKGYVTLTERIKELYPDINVGVGCDD